MKGADGTINASNWLNNIMPKNETDPNDDSGSTTGSTVGGIILILSMLTLFDIYLIFLGASAASGGGDLVSPPPAVATPQKPVNLLPEVPTSQSRKLTDKEHRDCEVIGIKLR